MVDLSKILGRKPAPKEPPVEKVPAPTHQKKRGRPRKADPISPAEASRRYRAKKKAERHEG